MLEFFKDYKYFGIVLLILSIVIISIFYSILDLSTNYNKPIGNGIITALDLNQAKQRSININRKKPNKGSEAAKAVVSILKNGPKKI